MSRHSSARLVYGLQLGTNPPKLPAASSALSLPLTHCLLFCVSDIRAVTSETSSLRCHHHTEFSSLYPRDAPFSLSSYSFPLCIPDTSDYERPRLVEAQETKPPPPPSPSLSAVSSYRCHRFNCLFSRHETGSRARVSFIAVPRPVALSIDFIVALATLVKATHELHTGASDECIGSTLRSVCASLLPPDHSSMYILDVNRQ